MTDMKEVNVRLTFHLAVGIILVLIWSYFVSEWWSPVIGVLAVVIGLIPAVMNFFAIGEPYRTETAQTTDEARRLVEDGFEYVCTHGKTMIFRRYKSQD